MELYKRGLVVLQLCFLFISINLGCGANSLKPLCKEEERKALLSFKRGIRSSSSSRLSSWAGQECCEWEGVRCHNITGRVLKLNLRWDHSLMNESTRLGGEISSSLLELKHLRHLDLSCNEFLGQNIPKFLGSISNLRYLNLSATGFGGVIPPQLGNLSKLQYLDIGKIGDLPWENPLYVEDLEWITGLTSLEFLDMTFLNLSKASNWLQVMNKLPSLSVLHLSTCDLYTIDPLSHVNFSSLTILDLSSNYFISSSLEWFASLFSLITLNLRGNNIQGSIPSCLQNMTSLRFLDLSSNNLVSLIPNWLYHMTSLEYLDLSSNKLQGKILNDIRNLTSITYLDLSSNAFEGDGILNSLADICVFQLSNMSHHKSGKTLEYLDLAINEFSGSFPDTFGQCKSLETLDLQKNNLSGQIPVSLGGIPSLRYLIIKENLFEGVISEKHLSNLTSLDILDASSNLQLILKVSSNWTPPFQLSELYLGACLVGPQFPAWLQTQKSLNFLDMSYAGISGSIPAWFWKGPYHVVDLSHNQLSGSIPSIHFDSTYLGSNKFTNPLPQISSDVVELDLSNNLFRGSLSPMLCQATTELNSMGHLDVSGNFLSGKLPNCWQYWSDLAMIQLDNNKLSGGIPSSLGSLQGLASLHLRNNRLSGILPPFMQNCTNLQVVDLSHNEFSGIIPMWMGNLTRETGDGTNGLRVLVLHSNKFSGDIPPELCNLSNSLQVLDLAYNSLSGAIPPCFGNFTSMVMQPDDPYSGFYYGVYNSYYVKPETILLVMKSIEYAISDNILALLTSIDLSCNNLSGEIPHELTNLHGLILLNLSNNHLQGKIPWDVGAMKSLQSLDLSINNLSGAIPQSMASMSFLGHLNLSYNTLSGRIPSGTQIQGFEPSGFTGNNGLCGPPLTDDCPGDHAPPSQVSGNAHQQHHEDEDEWMEMKWFYLSLPLGFVVGFWAVLGPLLFNRGWRHAYFQVLDKMKYRLLG